MLLLAAVVAGCTTTEKIMKADAAPDSGFLEEADKMVVHRERAPFNRMWVDPAFSASDYQSILVAPVNTEHVIAQSTWAKTSIRQFKIEEDLADVATEFRETGDLCVRQVEAQPLRDRRDAANDDTMILELAITELVPGKAFLGAVGLAAWAAPLPWLAFRSARPRALPRPAGSRSRGASEMRRRAK